MARFQTQTKGQRLLWDGCPWTIVNHGADRITLKSEDGRRENFGRTVLAAEVNKRRGIAVTIPVSRPGYIRSRELEAIELGRIRSHLEIGAEDLALL